MRKDSAKAVSSGFIIIIPWLFLCMEKHSARPKCNYRKAARRSSERQNDDFACWPLVVSANRQLIVGLHVKCSRIHRRASCVSLGLHTALRNRYSEEQIQMITWVTISIYIKNKKNTKEQMDCSYSFFFASPAPPASLRTHVPTANQKCVHGSWVLPRGGSSAPCAAGRLTFFPGTGELAISLLISVFNMIGDIGIRGLSDLRWIRP